VAIRPNEHRSTKCLELRSIPGALSWLLLLALVITSIASAKDLDERKWIFAESDHFSIYSAQSKRKTENLLIHLEALRSIFSGDTRVERLLNSKPTRLLATASVTDYRQLHVMAGSVGVYRSTLRENFIVVAQSFQMSEAQVMLHEFAHFALRSTSQYAFPAWWDEGYAEYVSGSRLHHDSFDIGLPLKGRLNDLDHVRWLPWDKLLALTSTSGLSGDETAAFYAQAWLLVHYLHNREDKSRSISASWERFANQMHHSNDPVESFENAFGISAKTLPSRVKKYARKSRFSYQRMNQRDLPFSKAVTVRTVDRQEIRTQLGQFALSNEDSESARHWFERILSEQEQHAAAIAGLAGVLTLDEQFEQAAEQFTVALELAPDNAEILVDSALLDLKRAAAPDAWFTSLDLLNAAEGKLIKARSIVGATTEIDTNLAYTWLSQNEDSYPAIELLIYVVKNAPSENWPRLLLAESMLRAGFTDKARSLAELVERHDHGRSSSTARARRLLQRIENDDISADRSLPAIAPPKLPSSD